MPRACPPTGSARALEVQALRCPPHHRRLIETAWALGYDQWAHCLGYGGHFLTKSRRFSVRTSSRRGIALWSCWPPSLSYGLRNSATLTRDRLDLGRCEVRVTEAKSRAGNRTVTFPAEIVPELRAHLDSYAVPGRSGLVFVGPKGGRLHRSNFNRPWRAACVAAGVPNAHFHDLRHTGGTLAATTGATIKELMARLGHSATRRDDLPARHQGP